MSTSLFEQLRVPGGPPGVYGPGPTPPSVPQSFMPAGYYSSQSSNASLLGDLQTRGGAIRPPGKQDLQSVQSQVPTYIHAARVFVPLNIPNSGMTGAPSVQRPLCAGEVVFCARFPKKYVERKYASPATSSMIPHQTFGMNIATVNYFLANLVMHGGSSGTYWETLFEELGWSDDFLWTNKRVWSQDGEGHVEFDVAICKRIFKQAANFFLPLGVFHGTTEQFTRKDRGLYAGTVTVGGKHKVTNNLWAGCKNARQPGTVLGFSLEVQNVASKYVLSADPDAQCDAHFYESEFRFLQFVPRTKDEVLDSDDLFSYGFIAIGVVTEPPRGARRE